MKTGVFSTITRIRELLGDWFSLTRSECASLILVMGILLAGLLAKAFLR